MKVKNKIRKKRGGNSPSIYSLFNQGQYNDIIDRFIANSKEFDDILKIHYLYNSFIYNQDNTLEHVNMFIEFIRNRLERLENLENLEELEKSKKTNGVSISYAPEIIQLREIELNMLKLKLNLKYDKRDYNNIYELIEEIHKDTDTASIARQIIDYKPPKTNTHEEKKCKFSALKQLDPTCFFYSVLNGFLLCDNLFAIFQKKLIEYYNTLNEEDKLKFNSMGSICPKDINIPEYIFYNIIRLYSCRHESIESPTDYIKLPEKILQEKINILNPLSALNVFINILYKKETIVLDNANFILFKNEDLLVLNMKSGNIPDKITIGDNQYNLEYANIILFDIHALSGIICHDTPVIIDSNYIDEPMNIDWRNASIEFSKEYKEKYRKIANQLNMTTSLTHRVGTEFVIYVKKQDEDLTTEINNICSPPTPKAPSPGRSPTPTPKPPSPKTPKPPSPKAPSPGRSLKSPSPGKTTRRQKLTAALKRFTHFFQKKTQKFPAFPQTTKEFFQ